MRKKKELFRYRSLQYWDYTLALRKVGRVFLIRLDIGALMRLTRPFNSKLWMDTLTVRLSLNKALAVPSS